jgi:hypothetical protein
MLSTIAYVAWTTLTYGFYISLGLACALILKILVWELSYYLAMKKFAGSNPNAAMGLYHPFLGS